MSSNSPAPHCGPNQVWATDVTYLPMAKGFAYLVAILDLYSRKVLAFRVSNTCHGLLH